MNAPRHPGQPPYQQLDPNPQYGAPARPPPPATRKWPWAAGGIVALFVVSGLLGGCADEPDTVPASQSPPAVMASPSSAAPTSVAAPVVDVVLPEVQGRNGGIVYDELIALGLTNLQLASQDELDTVVVLPQNWTAVSIEPGAGEEISSDQTVVVTMTKES